MSAPAAAAFGDVRANPADIASTAEYFPSPAGATPGSLPWPYPLAGDATAREHHATLQRVGSALGLEAGSDLHRACVPAIEALRSAALAGPPRHPTLEECEDAGRGPYNFPGKKYEVGGLPDTPQERERFEAYMRGHCWAIGDYDHAQRMYDTPLVRCCYGVWRDRGALPTTFAGAAA